jgi:hypothetical protein
MSLMVTENGSKPLMLAIRKFVFSSYRVFADIERRSDGLQKGEDQTKDSASEMRNILFRVSRQFRDQLSTLLSDIDLIESMLFSQNRSDLPSDLLQHEYDLTAYLVTTWHLCEIFFLNQNNSTSLELVNWLKVNLNLNPDPNQMRKTFITIPIII